MTSIWRIWTMMVVGLPLAGCAGAIDYSKYGSAGLADGAVRGGLENRCKR
jgi:hypothetical protein